jgi:hypothetical protein
MHDDDDDDDDNCNTLHAMCLLAYNVLISQKHSSSHFQIREKKYTDIP